MTRRTGGRYYDEEDPFPYMARPCGAFYVCAGADPCVLQLTKSTAIGAVRGFSLQNYVTLFTMEELRDMIVGTLALAVGAAV